MTTERPATHRAILMLGFLLLVLTFGSVAETGTAEASPTCPFPGTNAQGAGSTLQRILEEKLTGRAAPSAAIGSLPAVPHSALSPSQGYAAACASGPTVSYTAAESGPALSAFRLNGSGSIQHSLAFVGTDAAPDAEQLADAETATAGGTASGANPVVIPVAETSIAVVVHLPSGCEFKRGITWQDLNQIWNSKIKTWAAFSTSVGGAACEKQITRVVSAQGSGSAYQFKHYLSVLETTTGIKAEGPGCGLGTWASLQKIGPSGEAPNTTWPTCNGGPALVRAAGDAGIAEYVAGHENTIGYASLPDAKAKGATTAYLQDGEAEGVKAYGGPGRTEGSLNVSNCGARIYTVPTAGRGPFPEEEPAPGSGESVDWSNVFGAAPKVQGGLYPICGLTYAIGWSDYAKAGYGSSSTAYKEVARDFLGNYALAAEGRAIANNNWYQKLPSSSSVENNVQAAAELAVSRLG